jgi:hypothetical protein
MRRRHISRFALALGALGWLMACDGGTAYPASGLEPCSVLTRDEAATLLKGAVTQDVPSPITYRGTSTGGTCSYRRQNDPSLTLVVRTDGTPTGAQQQRFEAGLRRAPAAEFAGVGDRAYAEARPQGPQSVTVLRGDILVTVTVEGLGIDVAKRAAALVAPRLPVSVEVPAPPAPSRGANGSLDPALVGSWFLRQPSGRSLANLEVQRDGRFVMTLLAGNREQSGTIDADRGVLHLYPERGGQPQEIRYRVVDRNQMEWTDKAGNVTIVRRQFR